MNKEESEYNRRWYEKNKEHQRNYQKEWTKKNKEYYKKYRKEHRLKILEWTKKWQDANPELMSRQRRKYKKMGGKWGIEKVSYAIKIGRLASLSKNFIKCTDCPKRATQYDHRDYNKPLEVQPVCHSCNQKRGKAIIRKKEVSWNITA